MNRVNGRMPAPIPDDSRENTFRPGRQPRLYRKTLIIGRRRVIAFTVRIGGAVSGAATWIINPGACRPPQRM